MKILGVDISSKSTGWSLIDATNSNLIDYGTLNPIGKMSQAQKLNLFDVELTKIIEKYEPDYICIEDVISVVSVTTTKILARFNGVAIKVSYAYTKQDPTLVIPSAWKKYLPECNGSAKKAEIQLSVCKLYDLLDDKKIEYYRNLISIAFEELKKNTINTNIVTLKKELKKETKKKNKNRVSEISKAIKEIKGEVDKIKRENKKEFKKTMSSISMEIYTDSGLNEDSADAVGIAYYMYNKLKEEK